MSYSTKIINALEALWPKNVETQTDLIVQMLSNVPAEEHETVMQECAVFCVLSNSTNYMKDVSWGDVALRRDEAKENRFVALPLAEWERTKMMAKGDRWNRPWFASWAEWKQWADRINGKRRRAEPREVIEREPDRVKQLLEDREDMFRYPQRYVKTEAEVIALICETENAIVRWGGKARLDKVIDAEWDDAVAAGQVSEEQVVASKELARREAEYAEFPGLAAFIQSCGEPCRMVME
uniref:Uncharacterized protein n=1 Tax=viral metagenome TaxID=1070528 RepID=A0A6C0AJ50_9ZZZZ